MEQEYELLIGHALSPTTAYHLLSWYSGTSLLASQALLQTGIKEHTEEEQEGHHNSGRRSVKAMESRLRLGVILSFLEYMHSFHVQSSDNLNLYLRCYVALSNAHL
jgi:hypothetical protein